MSTLLETVLPCFLHHDRLKIRKPGTIPPCLSQIVGERMKMVTDTLALRNVFEVTHKRRLQIEKQIATNNSLHVHLCP